MFYWYQWLQGVHPRIDTIHPDGGRGKLYRLQYSLHGREYAMVITPPRGPVPYEWISHVDQDDESMEPPEITDVTEDVLVYLGPSYDFHGSASRLTPADIGYDGVLIFKRFGDEDEIYIGTHETFGPLVKDIH